MKTASKTAYQNLTTAQRFRAAIAALARNDETEYQKLESQSPDGEYVINKLSARVSDFATMAMAIRLDLLDCLCQWLLAERISADNPDAGATYFALTERAFLKCDSLITARDQWLESLGIPDAIFDAFDAPPTGGLQGLVDDLIKRSKGHADPEETKVYFGGLSDWFRNRHSGTCS